jgi:hypothetical protein
MTIRISYYVQLDSFLLFTFEGSIGMRPGTGSKRGRREGGGRREVMSEWVRE